MLIQLLFTILLTGAQNPQAPGQQTGRQLLQQVMHNYVGTASVADIEATGEGISENGRRHPIRFLVQGSKNMRIEHGVGKAQIVSTFANGAGWEDRGGKTTDLPDHVVEQRVRLFPFLDLLSEWNNPNLEVVKLETTELGNVSAYHIELRLKDKKPKMRYGRELNEEAEFYIEVKTLRVLRSVHMLSALDDLDFKIPSILDFSDYRNVNGVAIPFRITTTLGTSATGIHTSTTELQSVRFNVGMAPSLFEKGRQ